MVICKVKIGTSGNEIRCGIRLGSFLNASILAKGLRVSKILIFSSFVSFPRHLLIAFALKSIYVHVIIARISFSGENTIRLGEDENNIGFCTERE